MSRTERDPHGAPSDLGGFVLIVLAVLALTGSIWLEWVRTSGR